MSGYDIKKIMANSTQYFWSESDGQLYPILSTLLQEGCVSCAEDATSPRKKKVYSITSKGLNELKKWLSDPSFSRTVRDEMMLKLMFGTHMPKEIMIEMLTRYQDQLSESLATFSSFEKELHKEIKKNKDAKYWLMGLKSGLYIGEAKLSWVNECLAELKPTHGT